MTRDPAIREVPILAEIEDWLNRRTTGADLAKRLGVGREWVDEFESAVRERQLAQEITTVKLAKALTTGKVGDDDDIVVVLNAIEITRLFTDDELTESGDQEGTVVFNLNGQPTTVAWRRPHVGLKKWGPLNDDQKRLLFAGKPSGLLDIDAAVIESDEPEKEFFQKITDALNSAATFAGSVPGYGTAVAAGLNLGAAIAQLIKARIDDDAELQFLGSLGGSQEELEYGDYLLTRAPLMGKGSDIVIKFHIGKFAPILPQHVTILLDSIEFDDDDGHAITELEREDRVRVEITITRTPENLEVDEEWPRIASFQIDRPYKAENGADWDCTLGIAGKLLYDGPWGESIAIAVTVSGVPKEIHASEWMAVIQQTGALVASVAPPEQQPSIRRGFEIAETASATVMKFLPATRFVASMSSMFYVGNDAIDGLYRLTQHDTWEEVPVSMKLGKFGKVRLVLKLRVRLPK